MARRRGPSIQGQLLEKSREAALNAVQTFNNPLTTFKTEAFIVLMVIAWTYLLHAHYRRQGVEYRYFEIPEGSKRRKFCRTKSGAFKYWASTLPQRKGLSPLDGPTKSNLDSLVGARFEEVLQRWVAYLSATVCWGSNGTETVYCIQARVRSW